MEFATYVNQIRQEVEGKDPRKTSAKLRGSIVFLLRDVGGVLHRVTIRIERSHVEVSDDGATISDAAEAIVRGRLDDCAKFFAQPTEETIKKLELYGDTRLFGMVGELAQQKRDVNAVRFARHNK